MKRITIFALTMILVPAMVSMARDNGGSRDDSGGIVAETDKQLAVHVNGKAATQQPVIIDMNRPSSGGYNRNFPGQQQNNTALKQANSVPYYGRLKWTPNSRGRQWLLNLAWTQKQKNGLNEPGNKGAINSKPAAIVSHHHPYEPDYVRQKLKKLGVVSEPGYITNREDVIHTDKAHSMIVYPKTGFDNRPLHAAAVSSRNFNDKAVRAQMSMVNNAPWQDTIRGLNRTEIQANHYYWHNEKNFNYCHYIDNFGYHWYGWYTGNQYFWTRNYNNRWWLYDGDYDRWCFWNDGFWWWQDPYHIGDLYCYNNANYIPVNSAEDNVAVTVPDSGNTLAFTSPDRTRMVKVIADTQDAFMYDTLNPPVFNPVYLASGVKDVKFSDTGNGRPLEIILTLNDNSFDMFDGSGNPYNPGQTENDQAGGDSR